MSPPLLNLSLSVNQSVTDAFMGIRIKYELLGILGMPSEQPSANSEILVCYGGDMWGVPSVTKNGG